MEDFDQQTDALVKQLKGSDYQLIIGGIGTPGGAMTNYAAILRHKDDIGAQGSTREPETERRKVYSKSVRFDTTSPSKLIELIKAELTTLGIAA